MELLQSIAKQVLTDTNNDGKIDLADVSQSLQTLLADASGQVDIQGIITKLQNSGLSETVASWLGDGQNKALSLDSLTHLLDEAKIKQFATALNIDLETAKSTIASAIPALIDQISSNGQLQATLLEGAYKVQAEASEILANADAKSGGLLGKIKQLFS